MSITRSKNNIKGIKIIHQKYTFMSGLINNMKQIHYRSLAHVNYEISLKHILLK